MGDTPGTDEIAIIIHRRICEDSWDEECNADERWPGICVKAAKDVREWLIEWWI